MLWGGVVGRGVDDLVIDLRHAFLDNAAAKGRGFRLGIELRALGLLLRGQGFVGLLLGKEGSGSKQETCQQPNADIGTAKGHESLYISGVAYRPGSADQK